MKIKQSKLVCCVGIGGVGLSALARWLKSDGLKVYGTDLKESEVTDRLRKGGIEIYIGNDFSPKTGTDLIIYSPAIPENDPGRAWAKKHNILSMSYPEALAEILNGHKTIAVAGTHGKSTTTIMLGTILIEAGLDPTIVVGTMVEKWHGNFRRGRGSICVIEADEYNRSFLSYHPYAAIILNIDDDHLETYGDLNGVIDGFTKFSQNISTNGVLVLNRDDKNSQKIADMAHAPIMYYSIRNNSYGLKDDANETFNGILDDDRLPFIGRHMFSNALAAAAMASFLGVDGRIINAGLLKYPGAWRRFQIIGQLKGATIISDYAHHPSEIEATISACRQTYNNKKILAIFQPHQQRRLNDNVLQFAVALKEADEIIITEVYQPAGREGNNVSLSANSVVEELKRLNKQGQYFRTLSEAEHKIREIIKPDMVVLIMGAGDIHTLALNLVN